MAGRKSASEDTIVSTGRVGDKWREAKDEKGNLMLGDLAIRFDEKPISDRLLIHGVLHLLGYTHDKGKDYIQMRKKEKEVLAKLKILEKKS